MAMLKYSWFTCWFEDKASVVDQIMQQVLTNLGLQISTPELRWSIHSDQYLLQNAFATWGQCKVPLNWSAQRFFWFYNGPATLRRRDSDVPIEKGGKRMVQPQIQGRVLESTIAGNISRLCLCL